MNMTTAQNEKTSGRIRGRVPTGGLAAALPEPGTWSPAPGYADAATWEAVPEEIRSDLATRAGQLTGASWPQLLARDYARFSIDGNRRQFEELYFGRRDRIVTHALALLTGRDDAQLDELVDGLWLVCEESSWCVPAHERSARAAGEKLPDPERPTIDLFAAETAGIIAWIQIVLGDRLAEVSPPLSRRLPSEVRRRILDPFRTRHWHWQGADGVAPPNNWNPWIHSNILSAALVFERDKNDLFESVDRAISGLDHFLDGYPPDGGCDEGASYFWRAGASLFDCLDILADATDGRFDAFDIPVVRAIARYPLVAYISRDWRVNCGDGSARAADDVNAHTLLRFGHRISDKDVVRHAWSLRAPLTVDAMSRVSPMRLFPALLDRDWQAGDAEEQPYLPPAAYLPDTGLMIAREHPGSTDGLYLAAKGGHNGESHNHNDVGTVTLALDGRPLLIDVGVGEYTRKTFSAQRYEIWTMRSLYHNLPEINGTEQSPGREFHAASPASSIDDSRAEYVVDLAPAYPAQAGVDRWLRTSRLERAADGHGGRVVVEDEWWLQASSNQLAWSLMTADPVDTSTPGILTWPDRGLTVEYDAHQVSASVEDIAVDDKRLTPVWGSHVWRIRLLADAAAAHGVFRLTAHRSDS